MRLRHRACVPFMFALAPLVYAQSAANTKSATTKTDSALTVPITYSIESASLQKAKAVFDGTIWKIDEDGIDADRDRRFNVEHRKLGAALYINVTEAERIAGFEIDGVLTKWFDNGSGYKAQKIAVPSALKIGPSWRCAARNVTFTGDIEKTLVFCMQAKGRTTVDFMLGLPKLGWESETAAINTAIAAIGWTEAKVKQ